MESGRMVRWIVFAGLLILMALAGSCRHKQPGADNPDGPIVTVAVPDDIESGTDATFTVTWTGGIAPFTLSLDLGDPALENVPPGTEAASPFTHTTRLLNPDTTQKQNFTYRATVIDVRGKIGTTLGTYTIGPGQGSGNPSIDSAVYDETTMTLTVKVSDVINEANLTVSVTEPEGFSVDETQKTAQETGPLTAVFKWECENTLYGDTGQTQITVENGNGPMDTTSATITCPAFLPEPDTLYAVPMARTATTGDVIDVVVLTGAPHQPFLYMNSVRVTVNEGADYVANSFDVGAMDESPDNQSSVTPVDGIWGFMGTEQFLIAPDNFITAGDFDTVLNRMDFSINPMDLTPGVDAITGGKGELFNFRVKFTQAGTYRFNFEPILDVAYTYYSSRSGQRIPWGDMSNEHEGLANTVVVTDPAE